MIDKSANFLKRKLYNYITWMIALGLSGILTLGGAFQLGFALKIAGNWNNPSPLWIITIVLCGLALAFLVNKLFVVFMANMSLRKKASVYAGLIALYVILFTLLFFLRGRTALTWLASSWISGKRVLIIHAAEVITFLVIIPIALIDLLAFIESRYNFQVAPNLWDEVKQWSLKIRAFFSPDNSYYYHRFFIILFVGLSLLPLYNAPNIKKLESDFWGRTWLLGIYANTRFHLGDQIYDLSIYRNNNWFVFTGETSLDDYQNTLPFTQNELADIQRKLDRLDNLLTSKGIKLIVVVPPNKNTIYPEYMPPQIPVIGSQSRLDQVLDYQKQHGGFKLMDLRPALLAARTKRQIYYPCDTHWNPYGAFVAYQEIMQELGKTFPNLKPHNLEEYRSVPIQGPCDMPNLAHIKVPGGVFTLTPLFQRQVTEQDWQKGVNRGSFYNINFPLDNITTTNPDSSLPRLVMFRDSFADALTPFLEDHFSRGVFLWAYPADESYYDSEKPDVVILEYTERGLGFLLLIPG